MAIVSLEIDRDALPQHTDEQFEEWVMFCIGQRGGIEMTNPMSDMDMDARVRSVD